MNRLTAGEALQETQRLAVGFGSIKPAQRTEILRRWERVSGAVRPRPVKVTPGVLPTLGIGFTKVEVRR